MNEYKSMPNIRFKGFEDKFKVGKLENFFDIKDGTHSSPQYINSGFPLITSKNLTESGLKLENTSYISKSDFDEINKRSKVDVGDILFGMIGTIGTPVMIKENNFAIKNVALIKEFSKPEVLNIWLIYYFQSPAFDKFIHFRSAGGTQKFLALGVIQNMTLKFPLKKEQQKIGNLFAKLDKLLDLQQKKIDKLELLKKALLQKLFPKDNSKIPELRFKGFKDEWQEKKLSYVVEIIMGQSPSSINYYDTPIENSMILIQGNADIKHHNVKPRVWTTQITKITIPKDVLLTVRAPVGEVAKNKYEAVIGRGMAALRGNDFLYYNLEKLKMIGHWERLSTGSTFESISSNDIRDTKIKMPSYKEQKRVYSLFSKVDQLIELENKKLHNLQQVKKCLLQNMFVE